MCQTQYVLIVLSPNHRWETDIQRFKPPDEWLKKWTWCCVELRGHGIWCAQDPHVWSNLAFMPLTTSRECCVPCFLPTTLLPLWTYSFSPNPRVTGSKLNRPLLSNQANHLGPPCPGSPAYHSATERCDIPERSLSSSLQKMSWATLSFCPPGILWSSLSSQ